MGRGKPELYPQDVYVLKDWMLLIIAAALDDELMKALAWELKSEGTQSLPMFPHALVHDVPVGPRYHPDDIAQWRAGFFPRGRRTQKPRSIVVKNFSYFCEATVNCILLC